MTMLFLLISVLSPVLLLILAMLFSEVIEHAMDTYTIIIFGCMGFFSFAGFKHRMKLLYKSLEKTGEKVTLVSKIGAYFILFLPLIVALNLTLVIVLNNDNSMPNGSDTDTVHEVKKNKIEPEKGKKLDFSNAISSDDSSIKYEWFTPELAKVASMKEQFLEGALAPIALLDPRKDLSESELKKMQQTVDKLLPLLQEKKWSELLHFIDFETETPIETASLIMNAAVHFDAPDELYLKLANKGGELISTSLLTLVQRDQFDIVLKMENYGAILNSEILENTNILHFAMLTPLTPKSFDFLINRVDLIDDVGQLGVDIIGLSIVNANTNANYISHYLNRMIEQGASIKPQHLLLMEGLKKEHENVYNEIIEVIPELIVEEKSSSS